MPPITWDDVEGVDANLSTVNPELQVVILDRVEKLSATYYGGTDDPRYKLARILLAAHIASPYAAGAASIGGAGNPLVTSRREGDVAESYAAVASASLSGSHASTAHGRAFDELTRSMASRIMKLGPVC